MKADAGRKETEKLLADMEKRIAREYKQAEKEVEDKLTKYLNDFARKDAVKREALKNGDITRQEYNQWKTGQVMIGKRWKEMQNTLAVDFHNTNMIAKKTINGYMPGVYAINHNYGTFEVEKESKCDTSYTLYSKETVERMMRDNPDMLPPPGAKTSARIAAGKDIRWNKQLIQSSMIQSILQGESSKQIAKRLATSVGDKNMNSAIRNARTMTTGAENAGRVDAYKRAQKLGIDMQQMWLATLDGRTRDSHRDMDGETVDVGKLFSNGCRYPGDPQGPGHEVWNCRCTTIAQLKGFEFNPSDLGLRKNNKLGDMTYEEWKNEHKKEQAAKEKEIEFVDVTKEEAGEDWFEYENANIMAEYIRTGKMPTVDMFMEDIDKDTRNRLASEARLIQETGENTKTGYKTLYRGMVVDEDEVRQMFTPGETYEFNTITATATDKKVSQIYMDVENYGGGNGVPVIMEIQKPDGIYGFDRDGVEIVIPKGSEFKVVKNWMDEDGVVHISLYAKKGDNIAKKQETSKKEKRGKNGNRSKV